MRGPEAPWRKTTHEWANSGCRSLRGASASSDDCAQRECAVILEVIPYAADEAQSLAAGTRGMSAVAAPANGSSTPIAVTTCPGPNAMDAACPSLT
jgi:hypothetical protein